MGVGIWGIRGSAATLNDFQMAQMGSRCDCMIKSYPKKFGRKIAENLGRPNVDKAFLKWKILKQSDDVALQGKRGMIKTSKQNYR